MATFPRRAASAFISVLVLVALTATPSAARDLVPPAAAAVPAPSPSLEALLDPLTRDRAFKDSTAAMQVVSLRTGEEVWARTPDKALIPASTMKVVTAAAALRALGPSYRFTTELYVDGEVDGRGVLDGDLYVKGNADPTLNLEKLWRMAYELKLEGLREVQGDVVFDESFFGPDHALSGWDKEQDIENGPSYFPPIGALSVDANTATLVIGPGESVGAPASVQLATPAGEYIEIRSTVVTGSESSSRRLEIKRIVEEDRTMAFEVRGSVPAEGGVRRYARSVDDPLAQFQGAFLEMLKQHGVAVKGKGRSGAVPRTAELVHQARSAPLSAVLADMNKYSNNFIAEMVFRTSGAEVQGIPGTTAKGAQVVSDYLASLGAEPSEFRIMNGSGLSRDGLLRPSHLTAVMVDMALDRRVGSEFVSSLSIAGQDGTLWRRLSADAGRMRGKTGTIDGVHCLTGYLEAGDGEMYAFAFMSNDIRGGITRIKQMHDRFARSILTTTGALASSMEQGDE